MIVLDPPLPEFTVFLETNARAWAERDARRPRRCKGVVVVELMHNHASVLALNVLTARYLAELLGAGMLGVLSPIFTRYPLPVDQVRAFAASFGVKDTVLVGREASPGSGWSAVLRPWRAATAAGFERFRQTTLTRLRSVEGEALRRAVLELELDGVWIGDLVYDSYLQRTQAPTLERCDDDLIFVVERAFSIAGDYGRALREHAIRAAVVSHTVYVDYGILSRLTLKAGAPVYGKFGVNPIGIRKYRDLAEAADFQNDVLPATVAFFRDRLGAPFDEAAERFYPPSPNKLASFEYLRYGYGSDKREEEARVVRERLRLDPTRKTCAVMAHMFWDAPHCYPDLLFDDHFRWLDETLAFAAAHPEVQWLLRQHPYELMIGDTANFAALVRKHVTPGGPIRVVGNDVTTSSLFPVTDVLTTATGTAGIEFASVGVPCILAGRPFYGTLDFAVRPRTREAYFEALAAIPRMERLRPVAIAQAKHAALIYFIHMQVASSIPPPLADIGGRRIETTDMQDYWCDFAARVSGTLDIEADPLYRRLAEMERTGRTVMLKIDAE